MRLCSRSVAGVWAAGLFGLTGANPGLDAVWNRPRSPQAPNANDAHSVAAAKTRLRFLASRWFAGVATPLFALVPRYRVLCGHISRRNQLDLPHVSDLNPWAATLLDPASNLNSLVFQRLKVDPGAFQRRHHAP